MFCGFRHARYDLVEQASGYEALDKLVLVCREDLLSLFWIIQLESCERPPWSVHPCSDQVFAFAVTGYDFSRSR